MLIQITIQCGEVKMEFREEAGRPHQMGFLSGSVLRTVVR